MSALSRRVAGGNSKLAPPAPENPSPPSALEEGRTYPEVLLAEGKTAQIAWVTPDLAQQYLSMLAKGQRNSSANHVASLANDMAEGMWMFNAEAVQFDWDGFLINGQHRLWAIIKLGIPQHLLVVRGIDPAAYSTFDSGKKRAAADALKHRGVKCTSLVSAAARLLFFYGKKQLQGMGSAASFNPSPMTIDQVVIEHPGLVESATAVGPLREICVSMGAAAFCHYVLSDKSPDDAADFFAAVATGEGLASGDPRLTLRSRLTSKNRPYTRFDQIHFFFVAWNAFRRGEQVHVLRRVPGQSLPVPI